MDNWKLQTWSVGSKRGIEATPIRKLHCDPKGDFMNKVLVPVVVILSLLAGSSHANAEAQKKQREQERIEQETTTVIAGEGYVQKCVDGADGIPCGGIIMKSTAIKLPNKKWHRVRLLKPVRTEWRLSVHPEGQRMDYFHVSPSETDNAVEKMRQTDQALLGYPIFQDPRPADPGVTVRYDDYRLPKTNNKITIGYYWNPSKSSNGGFICRHVIRDIDHNAAWRLNVRCLNVLDEAHRRNQNSDGSRQ